MDVNGDGHRNELEIKERLLLNEHEIFSSLNTIKYAILTDPVKACNLIDDFAKILRNGLKVEPKHDLIPIEEEVKVVKSYLNLEMARCSKVQVHYEIEETDFEIPDMSLLFLVENAVHHGIRKKSEAGTITVRSCKKNGYYCVDIIDDGVGFEHPEKWLDPEGKPMHRGELEETGCNVCALLQIRERIYKIQGGDLRVYTKQGEGTRVTIKIPVDDRE